MASRAPARPLTAAVLAASLSGCLGSSGTTSQSASGTCLGDDCEVAGPHAPPADVQVDESIDLTLGMGERTWTFDVARGATGHVLFVVRDLATGEVALGAQVCLDAEIPPGSGVQSTTSSCSNGPVSGVGSGGTTTDEPLAVLRVDEVGVGTFRITASAPAQANELVVDIVVDNPEPEPETVDLTA